MKHLFITTIALFLFSIPTFSQSPDSIDPISLENFWGNKGALVEMTFHKSLKTNSKFGILSIAEYYGTYDAKKQGEENQFMAQTHLTYKLFNHFDFVLGGIINNVDGLRPTAGVQLALPLSDHLFFVAMPRIDLTQTHNAEILSLAEYTPPIHNNWSAYSRIEGLYNQNLQENSHGISYLRLRLGASYDFLRFGAGVNFASYGPEKFKENQVGLFIGALLF